MSESGTIELQYHSNCLPDHAGAPYAEILLSLHRTLNPKTYLEIGTLTGGTLALASCKSIAIDPYFRITGDVLGSKPACHFYQMPSDQFFAEHDPKAILGQTIDFAFLDGMHRCEFLLRDFFNTESHCKRNSIIALHDCLPTELPMTSREQFAAGPVLPHRAGWWTGDVWRVVAALKEFRPELRILCLDAAFTGVVLVTNLDPSFKIEGRYQPVVDYMFGLDLEKLTIETLYKNLEVQSTSVINSEEKIHAHFWL